MQWSGEQQQERRLSRSSESEDSMSAGRWEYKVVYVEGWHRISVEGQETHTEQRREVTLDQRLEQLLCHDRAFGELGDGPAAATDPSPPATASDSAPSSTAARAESLASSPGSSTRTRIPRSRAVLVSLLRNPAALPAAGLRIRQAEVPLASVTGGIFFVRCFGLRRRLASH